MKKKINITMQVTYEVTKECEVDSDVLEALMEVQDKYDFGVSSDDAYDDYVIAKAFDWISENIKEKDCYDWKAEIQDLTEEE